MALSMSFSVSIAENRVCSKRPRLMKRQLDSASSTPAMKSAERFGLPELDVVEHALHVDGQFDRLCESLLTGCCS